jgi:hypothetical protein
MGDLWNLWSVSGWGIAEWLGLLAGNALPLALIISAWVVSDG